jgi:hypothetical protein
MFPLVLRVCLLRLILIGNGEIYKLCFIRDVDLCRKGLSAKIYQNHTTEKFACTLQRQIPSLL